VKLKFTDISDYLLKGNNTPETLKLPWSSRAAGLHKVLFGWYPTSNWLQNSMHISYRTFFGIVQIGKF
jgi:hypothetical protein